MSKKKKGEERNWRGDDEEKLQAIVVADSFNRKFTPITQELPRALLPLGNKVLLDYTIEYLLEEGVQEIIVFCCSLGEEIRKHVSKIWMPLKKCKIQCVLSSTADCISIGDALREIDREGLIRSDFLLVPGDLVCNMKISSLLDSHKAKRKKEKNLVMSILYREMNPGHYTRCGEDDAFLAIDSENNKIVHYHKSNACRSFSVSTNALSSGRDIDVHFDLSFTNIAICSPQVAPLFTDNFDYQTLDDFVKGILINEDIMGDQLNAFIIESGYSARANDLHMYNAISLDLMNRWIYPIVPENSGKCSYKRNNIYIENGALTEKNCVLSENVILGCDTHVGEGSRISRSVIGANCKIGKNVTINNSYIWDDVVIEDNASITQSLICSKCSIKRSVKLIDSILSFNVCVDEDQKLNPQTRLSLVKPDSLLEEIAETDKNESNSLDYDPSIVGRNGKGYLWPFDIEEEGFIPSLVGNDYESSDEESSEEEEDEESLPPSPPTEHSNFHQFHMEVMENLKSGILENIAADNIALEINASKFKFNISIRELCQTIVNALLELTVNEAVKPKQEIIKEFEKVVKCLHPLLIKYYNSSETQSYAIQAIEDYFISLGDSSVHGVMATILLKCYNQDIIEESVIMHWYKNMVKNDDTDKNNQIKTLHQNENLIKLITWLEEAEEESDDDASD